MLPILREGYRVKEQTVPEWTVAGYIGLLALLGIAFSLAGLWLSVATESINTVEWALVGWQRWHYGAPATTT